MAVVQAIFVAYHYDIFNFIAAIIVLVIIVVFILICFYYYCYFEYDSYYFLFN